jgi:hypothetical protein
MGGKSDAPAAPNYAPILEGTREAASADLTASGNLYGSGSNWLDLAQQYGRAAGDLGGTAATSSDAARNWGLQQFNDVWPYAKDYLSSQASLSKLAGENASDSVTAARQQRQWGADTYSRYMTSFAPVESAYAKSALDYNSPARAAQASAAAKGDYASAADAAIYKREQDLKSYGIDPSQARYQGEASTAGIQRAAGMASAGTKARLASEQTGLGLQESAIKLGQNLPTASTAEYGGATTGAAYGLKAGEYGGTGIPSATGLITAGSSATGTPYQYATLSNPYTTLAGQAGSTGTSLSGYGTSALGNISAAANSATSAQNDQFQNKLAQVNANNAQDAALWGGIAKGIGAIGSLALAPVTGGGSLLGNALGGGGNWSGSAFA